MTRPAVEDLDEMKLREEEAAVTRAPAVRSRAFPLADRHRLGAFISRRRAHVLQLGGYDAAALILAGILSAAGAEQAGKPAAPVGWTIAFILLVLGITAVRGGYRFRLESSPFDQLGGVLIAATVAAMLVLAVQVVIGPGHTVGGETVRLWGLACAFLVCGRFAGSVARLHPRRRTLNTLIIGAGSVGQVVAKRLHERPEWGMRPVGFLDKEPREVAENDLPVLGASWDLEKVVREQDVDHVIVTFSTAPHAVLLSLVRRCRALGVEVSVVPRLFEEVSNRVLVEHLGGVPLLRVDQVDPRGWQFEIKYFLDRVVGSAAVLLLSPVLLLLALAVRLSSPGPILFRQLRVGLDGHHFEMLKFRTMRMAQDGEIDGHSLEGVRAPGVPVVDRRTTAGKFLRRWSLDELPQLINLARGDMSLIGPRPERVDYVPAFVERVYRYGDRHRVKSGLTGWAQVQGLRGDAPLADRAEWDNYYVENWSPWLDLKILVMTVPAVLSGRGAQ
jgi:exopolysaccharide biosynthesis polyprenyl glycosylphosphotransferase